MNFQNYKMVARQDLEQKWKKILQTVNCFHKLMEKNGVITTKTD